MKSDKFNEFFADLVLFFIGILCAAAIGALAGWLISVAM
jgi:hypothetical protein